MYEAFYGFKEKPFSMLPDPDFLFLSKKHQTALTLLEYGLLNHIGFCVISGEPGTGKTTILRTILGNIGDDVTVGLITNTHQTFGGLLDWILSVFNLHQPNLSLVELHQVFMDFLIDEYANNRTVLLVVDEAQNMNADSLEELRMLSNVNSEKDQLLQIVLAGQPELKDILRKPELRQFAQRIAVDYHLGPLSVEETCGYIQHRLFTAGAENDVFTPAACERIHNFSGGTPRLINLLCETVLVYGFADQQKEIDVDLVDEMVLEHMKDSIVPIVNRDVAKKDNGEASKKLEKDFPWIRSKAKNQVQEKFLNDELSQDIESESDIKQRLIKDQDVLVGSAATEKYNSKDALEVKNKGIVREQATAYETTKGPVSTDKKILKTNFAMDVKEPEKTIDVDRDIGNVAEGVSRKHWKKYGIIMAVLGLVLIVFALVYDYVGENNIGQSLIKVLSQQTKQDRSASDSLNKEKSLDEATVEAETGATKETETEGLTPID